MANCADIDNSAIVKCDGNTLRFMDFFKTTINITSTECEANKQNKQTNK